MVSQHWVALCSGRQDCLGHDIIQCENSIQKQTFTIHNLYYWHCQCLCSFVLLVGCGVVANVEGHKRKLCWPHTFCKERVVQQKSFRCRNSLSQKNSHLNMTYREGHSKGSFRSSFFMLMMVVILPPTQYVVEEKLRMQMFLIWRQMPNPATAYLRTMGNACIRSTLLFLQEDGHSSRFLTYLRLFFHVIAVFSLIQEK